MITGAGVNPLDAGEVWHLLDQRFNIPVSHLEPATFNRVDLNKYNTLILVSGTYTDLNKDKLKAWVQGGGNLILMEEAVTWAAQGGISNVAIKKTKGGADSTQMLTYVDKEQIEGAQGMRGAIFRAELDLSHPLAMAIRNLMPAFLRPIKYIWKKAKIHLLHRSIIKAIPYKAVG